MNDADRETALRNRIRELETALNTIAEDVDPGRPLLTMTQVRELPDRVRAVLHDRDTARAEADALRAEVARLRPLRALFDRAQTAGVLLMVVHRPDGAWFASVNDHVVTGEAGSFDVVIAAACESKRPVGRDDGSELRVAGHDDHPLSRFTCPPFAPRLQLVILNRLKAD